MGWRVRKCATYYTIPSHDTAYHHHHHYHHLDHHLPPFHHSYPPLCAYIVEQTASVCTCVCVLGMEGGVDVSRERITRPLPYIYPGTSITGMSQHNRYTKASKVVTQDPSGIREVAPLFFVCAMVRIEVLQAGDAVTYETQTRFRPPLRFPA